MSLNIRSGRKSTSPRYSEKQKKFDPKIPIIGIIGILTAVALIGGFVTFGIIKLISSGETADSNEIYKVNVGDLISKYEGEGNTAVNGKKTICIDPGHGFADIGRPANQYMQGKNEAYFNLVFSLHLKSALEELGYNVILTHDGNKIPDGYDYDGDNLYSANDSGTSNAHSERRDYAMAQKPDYFISIHCDSFDDESVHGMRFYHSSDNAIGGVGIDLIMESMKEITAIYPNTTTKKKTENPDETYAVIKKWNGVPAIMCELGFLSNPSDTACLLDEEWNKKTAAAIASGINEYFS